MLAPEQKAAPLPPPVLERFRQREQQAFFTVYETYGADVRAAAARFFRSPFEREEAVQEIWLNVHEAAPSFDPARGELRAWLRVVANNRCLQLLRAKGRRPVAMDQLEDDTLASTQTPHLAARDARLRAAVEAFAARLSLDEQQVFRLAFAEEARQDEVAQQLGISVRRYKYLKKKILQRAESSPELARVLEEVLA